MRETLDSFLNLDGDSTDVDVDEHRPHKTPIVTVSGTDCPRTVHNHNPLPFLKNGTLNWALLVSQHTRLESDFVHDSVRKNLTYAANCGTEDVRLRKDGSKVDQFGTTLMRKLRKYDASSMYSSSGGYRQMRHTGLPNGIKVDPRGEARHLVADKASNVSGNNIHSNCAEFSRVVFQEYQKIRDKHYRRFTSILDDRLVDAGVSALSELTLAPGRFVFVLFQRRSALQKVSWFDSSGLGRHYAQAPQIKISLRSLYQG